MPEVFFTSDTHFGHANIIKYCNRPFASAAEMDEALIDNWNDRVRPEDTVYHLGDFSLAPPGPYLHRLNGHVMFVFGNHDKQMRHLKDRWREWEHKITFLPPLAETDVNGQQIILCHYAMRVWNKSHRGSWHLYGHSHSTLPDEPASMSFDVGVDAHAYHPLRFNEVAALMAKKSWKPIDHHGS